MLLQIQCSLCVVTNTVFIMCCYKYSVITLCVVTITVFIMCCYKYSVITLCVCEEHPRLFWEVATGLGGVVGKKGAGDGGFHI